MAVRIGIDGRSLSKGPPGVATVVRNLLAHIPQLTSYDSDFPANNFFWNQIRVPLAALRLKWDLFHSPSYTAPLMNACPTVLSVHDVSYLVSGDLYPYKLDRFRKWYYLSSMKHAARVLVPSEFSRQEVLRFLPGIESRIRKIPLGVSTEFRVDAEMAKSARRKWELPGRFLLHVGDIHPRRNVELIQAAAAELGVPLVLVGRPLRGAIPDKGGAHLLLSGVSQEELVGIYNAATVLVYPSIYEGFGFPILEAMASGLPVVAANRASIPEVCGDAGVLVEPSSEAILEGIGRIMESREEWAARGFERVRHFTWEKTARKTYRVYEELL